MILREQSIIQSLRSSQLNQQKVYKNEPSTLHVNFLTIKGLKTKKSTNNTLIILLSKHFQCIKAIQIMVSIEINRSKCHILSVLLDDLADELIFKPVHNICGIVSKMVQSLSVHSSIQRILPQSLGIISRQGLFLRLEEIILFADGLLCQLLNDFIPFLISNQQTFFFLLYCNFLFLLLLNLGFLLSFGSIVDRCEAHPESLIFVVFLLNLSRRRKGSSGVGSYQLRLYVLSRILFRFLTFHRTLLFHLILFILLQLDIHKRFLIIGFFPPTLVNMFELGVELNDWGKDREKFIVILKRGDFLPKLV